MAATTSIRRILDTILTSNPDFDILTAQLYDSDETDSLHLGEEEPTYALEALRTYQRIIRIAPDENVAYTLLENGFDSAHSIAAIPEHRFLRENAGLFKSEEQAQDVHERARNVKARTKHVWANVQDMVASKHYRSTLFNNVDESVIEYFQNLPSYQALFGGLNYCECAHCRSIFSAAAYFLDIMRITDEYITDVNTNKMDDNIPAGFTLEERRPDLFELKLTCANTDIEVPYLQIVNRILENRIELETPAATGTAQSGDASAITLAAASSSSDGAYTGMAIMLIGGTGIGQTRTITSYTGSSKVASVSSPWEVVPDATTQYRLTNTAYQTIATQPYPFNLPFNLPLEEIRLYLTNLQTTLSTVFLSFLVPQPELPGVKEIDVAREYLHLSLEEYYIVTTPDATVAGLSAAYGYADINKHLPFTGAGKVAFTANSTTVQGSDGTQFTTQLSRGDILIANNQSRIVKSITSNTQLEVETAWSTATASPSAYTVEPLDSLDAVTTFLYRTGLRRDQLYALLYQELDAEEQTAEVANTFFINATGESLPPMSIVRAGNGDPFDRITNVSLKRLDRLNRFIRLSAETDWSYANVDWSFRSVGATEITADLIKNLASIEKLHRELGLEVDAVCAFWFDMKTIGRVTASNPQDLFDRVFNSPALLNGKNPYGSNQPPVPFDPARPLTWNIDDRADLNGTIRSRLTGALVVTDNDLTAIADFYLAMSGAGGRTIELTLSNLTWLYRLTKLPAVLGISINEYLRMLFLIWCSAKPVEHSDTLVCDGMATQLATIAGVLRVYQAIQWQKKAPFTVYELQYIITGARSEYVDPGYTPDSIRPFIQNLSVGAAGSHVTKDSFVFDDIDADKSAKLFDAFVADGVISDIGIVLGKTIDYESISYFFPVSRDSFAGVNITAAESAQVFDLLVAQSYLRSIEETNLARVSDVFTVDSSLDFLFTNMGSGQQRLITAYDGANRTATVQTDWTTTPNNTSLYVLGTRVNIGTARGGTADTTILDVTASDISGIYDGMTLLIESGTGNGQARVITSYNGTTKTAEMDSDWDVKPDTTSVYSVFAAGATAGTARGGDVESILLADSASSIDDVYVGMQIVVRNPDGTMQFRRISAYAGTDKRATVDIPWEVIPTDEFLYSVNLPVNKGQARSGSATTIQLSEEMSSEDSAYDSVSIGLYNDPLAVLKRGEVRKILLQIQRDIRHTVEILLSQTTLQDSNVIDGLARFLGTQSDMVAAQLPFVAKISELTDYRKAFLTPIPEGEPVPEKVPELIEMLARGTMLARNLALSATQVYGMASNPDPYVFDTNKRLTLANVQLITTFKELTIDFRDKDNHLLEYFAESDEEKKLRLLSVITNWPYPQIVTLVNLFWPTGGTYKEDYNTVGGVQRMKVSFDLSTKTGIDINSLLQLCRLGESVIVGAAQGGDVTAVLLELTASDQDNVYVGSQLALYQNNGTVLIRTITSYHGATRTATIDVSLPAQVAVGTPYRVTRLAVSNAGRELIRDNWLLYTTLASSMLDAVNAKYNDAEFEEVFGTITETLNDLKRDALLGYAIWLMNKRFEFIRQPSDLYQYLLIDTEMGGCMTTTPIVEGIAAVQLYMQRCRMNLEPGVTEIPIPDTWWQWISTYRVWEVNRKIFLYPENYVDPTLRKSQTPQFRELSDELLQTNITNASVSDALGTYLERLDILAHLQQRIAYNHTGELDERTIYTELGDNTDVMYLIGRTRSTPFTFYYREVLNKHQGTNPVLWGAWQEIDLTINATYVTPVHAFSRLFLFWNEMEVIKSSAVVNNNSSPQSVVRTTVKYSFLTPNRQWIQPQILAEGFVVNAHPANYDMVNNYPDVAVLSNPDGFYWNMPYPIRVARGMRGTGTLTFISGLKNAAGINTLFQNELSVGDRIWCAGNTRTVTRIDTDSQQITVDKAWTVNATKALYRIIPQDRNEVQFPPFTGTGTVITIKDLANVAGTGTKFGTEVLVGDRITVGSETRLVLTIRDQELVVDRPWGSTNTNVAYTVLPGAQGDERLYVLLGSTLNISANYQTAVPPQESNPGRDSFIAQRQSFNDSLYQTLMLASRGKIASSQGNVNAGVAAVLRSDLSHNLSHLLIVNDSFSAENNPTPYRPVFNRNDALLRIVPGVNTIVENYWGGSVPGDIMSLPVNNGGFDLLYHIAAGMAVLFNIVNKPGWFIFDNGDETFLLVSQQPGLGNISDMVLDRPYPTVASPNNEIISAGAYTSFPMDINSLKFVATRLSTSVVSSLGTRLLAGGVDALLTIEAQLTPELPFNRFYSTPNGAPPAHIDANDLPSPTLDFNGSYGGYFWELFFYAPFLIADQLHNNHRYEEAQTWYEYIFNPTQPDDGTNPLHPNDRYWRFLPFRGITPESLLDILTNEEQIAIYNNDPFDPDALARLRPTAYPKAIVMRYIDNLIEWGDMLFTLDTRESINQATNLYIMASDMLGRRPESIGSCPTQAPASFNDIKRQYVRNIQGTAQGGSITTIILATTASSIDYAYNGLEIELTGGQGTGQRRTITRYEGATRTATVGRAWDIPPDNTSQYLIKGTIPEFLIDMENTPFVAAGSDVIVYEDVPFNDIQSYFCVPENSELIAYWDIVEDRLYKIRHCMNIAGVERSLALFAPPLNPRDLIRAASGGAGSMLAPQIEPPIPNYRFSAIIDSVKGITSNVIQLGGSLLAALEKQDGETLSLLLNTQQKVILDMTTSMKEKQIEQSIEVGDSLLESRSSAQARYTYYTNLLVRGLSPAEIQNIEAMGAALVFNILAGITRTAASIGYAVPNVGSPFAMTYGGAQIGAALNAASGVFELGSFVSSYIAERSAIMAGYERRAEDWELQKTLADLDVKQIDAQISANTIQTQIAERDLEVHLRTIEQNDEMLAYLKSKFTNKELYQWMAGRLLTVYFQTYSLALELARSAQRAFQYELNSDKTFINFNYWDDARKGLMAGEGLMLAVNQMEKSYLDGNVRTLEIEKSVSLLQLNPRALLDLRNNGECTFELPEKLFDYDFPGHYCRKIKTVSITIPAVVGPYQNIKATLTQLGNQVVLKPNVDAVNFLLGGSTATSPGPDALRSNWWANQQIAISRGAGDSGMFELNFNDPRYLPFEGTGAVSSWRLSMPRATNRIDFEAVSDVIIQVRYTALDGGAAFRRQVTSLPSLKPFTGARFLSLRQQYSQQWFTFMNEHPSPVTQTMSFPLSNPVPPHVENAKMTGFYFVLDLPADVDASSTTPYIVFELTNDIAVDVRIGAGNAASVVLPSEPLMSKVVGIRNIIFDLDKTPAALKDKNGEYLNPDVLLNIGLILYYRGDVQW